jgi:hypothetical protein
MKREQKIVITGAASGIVFMIASVWLLSQVLPVPVIVTMGDRLAYALKWDALAAVPFFVMLVAVGNARFFSGAIDPTLHKESPGMVVDGRVADNTTQQLLLFLIGSIALAANLAPERLPIVGAAAITFVIVRIAFWIGYRIDPLYRAFGFAGTAYLNFGLLGASLWLSLT